MFKDMAQRLVNAENSLITCIVERGFDPDTAGKIADLYVKEKLVKLNPNDGQFKLKHGVFFEQDVLQNAADMVT